METERKCSKCETRPAASKHRWCKECKAGDQSKNRESQLIQARGAGFGDGIEAMRKTLADEFWRLGLAQVTCCEVSNVIRQAPRPTFKEPS